MDINHPDLCPITYLINAIIHLIDIFQCFDHKKISERIYYHNTYKYWTHKLFYLLRMTHMPHCFKLGRHLSSSKCCAYGQIRAIWQKSVSWSEFYMLNSDFDFKQPIIPCYKIYQLVGMIEALLLILEYPTLLGLLLLSTCPRSTQQVNMDSSNRWF